MTAPAVMFHVAPASAREHISAGGLWARGWGESDTPDEEGVYLFDNLADCDRFILWVQQHWPDFGPADVWQVTLSALEQDPDWFCDLTDTVVEDPREPGGWLYPDQHLDVERLTLLRHGV